MHIPRHTYTYKRSSFAVCFLWLCLHGYIVLDCVFFLFYNSERCLESSYFFPIIQFYECIIFSMEWDNSNTLLYQQAIDFNFSSVYVCVCYSELLDQPVISFTVWALRWTQAWWQALLLTEQSHWPWRFKRILLMLLIFHSFKQFDRHNDVYTYMFKF